MKENGKTIRIKPSKNRGYIIKVLKKEKWYYKVNVYDHKGRLISKKPYRVAKRYLFRGIKESAVNIINIANKVIHKDPFQQSCSECDEIKENEFKDYVLPRKESKKIKKNKDKLCNYFDQILNKGVPEDLFKQALKFYKKNRNKFKTDWITIADYGKRSNKKRFFLVNIKTGEVKKHKVSHGSGKQFGIKYGDSKHRGYLKKCQGPTGSRTNMTRPGFFVTAELYHSYKSSHKPFYYKKGKKIEGWPNFTSGKLPKNGLRLDGLTPSVNKRARQNGVVIHGAGYNRGTLMGRSSGCPSLRPDEASDIVHTIKNGSLYYASVPQCSKDMRKVLKQVKGWENTCQ